MGWSEPWHFEPAFVGRDARLHRYFPVAAWNDAYAEFLAERVVTDPSDLFAHVARIHQHLAGPDADPLFGALLDLFIALGDRGHALRRRLVAAARKRLTPDQHRFLDEATEPGIDPGTALPSARCSVSARVVKVSLR